MSLEKVVQREVPYTNFSSILYYGAKERRLEAIDAKMVIQDDRVYSRPLRKSDTQSNQDLAERKQYEMWGV
jgi:hypothetical protein